MARQTTKMSKGRAWLWAVATGIASALGYLVAELITQHDLSFVPFGMLGIFVLLTLFSYFINVRNVPKRS